MVDTCLLTEWLPEWPYFAGEVIYENVGGKKFIYRSLIGSLDFEPNRGYLPSNSPAQWSRLIYDPSYNKERVS